MKIKELDHDKTNSKAAGNYGAVDRFCRCQNAEIFIDKKTTVNGKAELDGSVQNWRGNPYAKYERDFGK